MISIKQESGSSIISIDKRVNVPEKKMNDRNLYNGMNEILLTVDEFKKILHQIFDFFP